ncbi:MAG: YdiU family protein [Verrucomicrobiota bacterium]
MFMPFSFDNSYARLPSHFFTRETPASVPNPQLILLNEELAEQLGLDTAWLKSPEGVSVLSGNAVAKGSVPIAQAYAGHQFGGFVPQLGDGRALLLGEVVDRSGARFDLQLKGSGRTAFSRGGDGKSALGPVLREYIVSEAMEALGVPTTRALAAVSSGETVLRQEGPIPGGIFTRVASSHVRVGTFQYFRARDDFEALRILADYVIERHYPQCLEAEAPYRKLLEEVAAAQAGLVAQWMSLGFIHGVMNTDNTALSGETIDYGPCAFMDTFHPQKVFSSIDRTGRYAWGNQANIALWNLSRFAETLLPLLSEDSTKAIEQAESILESFPNQFRDQYDMRFRAKLGLPETASDGFIRETLELMAEQKVDFTLFFRSLTQVAQGQSADALRSLFADPKAFEVWLARWKEEASNPDRLDGMRSVNPVLIPRNHRVEEVIQAAYRDDYDPFRRLVGAFKTPFAEDPEHAELEAEPQADEIVRETFCGT